MRNIIDKMNSLYPISDETIQILKENTVLCVIGNFVSSKIGKVKST